MACQHSTAASFSEQFGRSLVITDVKWNTKEPPLGKGAEAEVHVVNWLGTFCAAKTPHNILLEDELPGGKEKFIERFHEECVTWSKLVHPHIVQFLGVYFFESSPVPMLIMEKMDTSLWQYFETHSRNDFLLEDKVFVLRQIAQALSYLHGRPQPLVHHDLSPKNVLVNEGSFLTKLTDFGMSKYLSSPADKHGGTLPFMPPEGIDSALKEDKKLDVFSYGNVIIATVTHEWPIPDKREVSKGDRTIFLNERQRRQQYLDRFTQEENELFDIVCCCLENHPDKRPTSIALVAQMRQIEQSCPRVHRDPVVVSQIHDDQLHMLLRVKEAALQKLHHDSHTLCSEINRLQQEREQLYQDKERLQQELDQARMQGWDQDQKRLNPPTTSQSDGSDSESWIFQSDRLSPSKIHWVDMPELPTATTNSTAVVIDHDVYVVGGTMADDKSTNIVQVLNLRTSEWRRLPPAPQYHCEAVRIYDNLVLIGGRDSSNGKITNMVSTWMTGDREWMQTIPPMNTKRCAPGVLLLKNHLFVFGGKDDHDIVLDSYEVLDIVHNQWKVGCGTLPQPLWCLKMGVFNQYAYITNAVNDKVTRNVWKIPVHDLEERVISTKPSSIPIFWTPVANAPNYHSSLLTDSRQPVLIGGSRGSCPVKDIYCYKFNCWVPAGQLSKPRIKPTVITISDRSFIVIGGDMDPQNKVNSLLKSVEIIICD